MRGRRFDAAGKPLGPAFALADGDAPTLSPAESSGFLLTWQTVELSGHAWRACLFARRLSSSGQPHGDVILVRRIDPLVPSIGWSGRGFFAAVFFNPDSLSVRRLPL